jgi:hypothetical protein
MQNEPGEPKLSVADILAFSDAELAQYMNRKRRPDGTFVLDFDGCDKLFSDRRQQLAERLK